MPFKSKHRSTVETATAEPMPSKEQPLHQAHEQVPARAEHSTSEESSSEHERIAQLAYWQERGCPEESPEEDWFRAEQKLAKQVGRETGLPAIDQSVSRSA